MLAKYAYGCQVLQGSVWQILKMQILSRRSQQRLEEGMSVNPTFNVSVIFGKRDEPMLLACACQLIELIRFKEMWKIPIENERGLKEMWKIPMELHMLKEMWKITLGKGMEASKPIQDTNPEDSSNHGTSEKKKSLTIQLVKCFS
ncbi:uncharacterized protein LOC131221750 [Magnolia sinica]|uniref:uncharacterized protein LOC131221750 n=1 Tax=Magnolia sinica TaxID=86752 RepID=UPI00265999FD|nr:uncharacterized protein LOC131221750 [Magnolia sinica]